MPAVEVVLGIDIGTGSTKAGLIDGDGRLLSVGRCPHPIVEPSAGRSESDPESWLASTRRAVAAAVEAGAESLGADGLTIVGVGFSGQMHGVVVCDSAAKPIRPAVLWSDGRSQPYLDELRGQFTAQELAALANPIVAGMAGPTIAALRRLEPESLTGAAKIMQPKDWVRYRLTGQWDTDASDASATLLWDVEADTWSSAACRVFDVDRDWLPPVLGSDAQAGAVTAAGVATFGLEGVVSVGTPVAVGAADTAAALVGAGIASGQTQVSTGTGGQVAMLVDRIRSDPTARTHLFRSAGPSASVGSSVRPCADNRSAGDSGWYVMAAIQNAGVAIDWALGLLSMSLVDADRAVAETPPGSNGVVFLPYLTGERTPHMNVGLSGCWSGLRPSTTRAELARSVFEGVAFALRDGLDAMAETAPGSAFLAGGGSTAKWWRQMLADVLDITLVPHDASDASVRGAGLLGWSMLGREIDATAAVSHGQPVTPSSEAACYEPTRKRFQDALRASDL